jgi:D-beta-D-heptose 7-phosphate kinase/D-beta-D-heptose 1-phosphate adenosyltransferase
MITPQLMKSLKEFKTKIIVDPKPRNVHYYNGVYMITPNLKEWELIKDNSRFILNSPNYVLVTKGSDGMDVIKSDSNTINHIPGNPVEIYNVSGAGDTVVAVMAVCMSMGLEPYEAAQIANECAAYVVTKPGTSVVSENKFIEIYQSVR